MAKINLHIEADSPDDFWATIAGLNGLGRFTMDVRVDNSGAEQAMANLSEYEAAQGEQQAPKRVRRTKAQIEADNAAAAASAASQPEPTSAAPASDPFAAPAEPVQENPTPSTSSASQASGSATIADVRSAMAKCMEKHDGNKVLEVLKKFTGEDGQPVTRAGALKPEDYAQAAADLASA